LGFFSTADLLPWAFENCIAIEICIAAALGRAAHLQVDLRIASQQSGCGVVNHVHRAGHRDAPERCALRLCSVVLGISKVGVFTADEAWSWQPKNCLVVVF